MLLLFGQGEERNLGKAGFPEEKNTPSKNPDHNFAGDKCGVPPKVHGARHIHCARDADKTFPGTGGCEKMELLALSSGVLWTGR